MFFKIPLNVVYCVFSILSYHLISSKIKDKLPVPLRISEANKQPRKNWTVFQIQSSLQLIFWMRVRGSCNTLSSDDKGQCLYISCWVCLVSRFHILPGSAPEDVSHYHYPLPAIFLAEKNFRSSLIFPT